MVQIEPLIRCGWVSVNDNFWAIHNRWSRYLARWFTFILSRLSSKIKIIGQSSGPQKKISRSFELTERFLVSVCAFLRHPQCHRDVPPCAKIVYLQLVSMLWFSHRCSRAPEDRCRKTPHFFVFCPRWPWPLTLTFELGRYFYTVVTAKFHHPTCNRSEVIVLSNKQTNWQTMRWFSHRRRTGGWHNCITYYWLM